MISRKGHPTACGAQQAAAAAAAAVAARVAAACLVAIDVQLGIRIPVLALPAHMRCLARLLGAGRCALGLANAPPWARALSTDLPDNLLPVVGAGRAAAQPGRLGPARRSTAAPAVCICCRLSFCPEL